VRKGVGKLPEVFTVRPLERVRFFGSSLALHLSIVDQNIAATGQGERILLTLLGQM
jgi:hypothetical protein